MSAALIHIADPSVPGGWRPATAADFAGASPGGGSGDASAANQATQITRETEIRDRLPAALVSGALPVVARGGLTALGFEQITSLSSSAALTVPSGATIAVVQAEGADVRWRDDGTAPTATVGMLLPAGAELRYTGALAALRLIQASAGATVNVSYYA